MFYFSYLPEGNNLSHWIIYTGSAAILLISTTIMILIWSLLRTRRVWWLIGLFLLLLGTGVWSLRVAFVGSRQLNLLQHLIENNPEATIYQPGSTEATFNMYTEACQFWFGVVVAAFVLLASLGVWWLVRQRKGLERSSA